jgi:hypothetical protein
MTEESAYETIRELGQQGMVHFVDVNIKYIYKQQYQSKNKQHISKHQILLFNCIENC